MNKTMLMIIGLVAATGIGLFAISRGGAVQNDNPEMPEVEKAMVEEETQMNDSDMAGQDAQLGEQKDEMMSAGSYQPYAPEKLAMAETGDVVLFFHASWCPSCRALNADIEKNLTEIPVDVTILKTDYDRETELKKKYGVTTQHTLVQVDKNGTMLKKWSGGAGLESVLSEIQ